MDDYQQPGWVRAAVIAAVVTLAGVTSACAGSSPPTPAKSSVTSVPVVDADSFQREFAFAVPQLRTADGALVRRVLNGVCFPQSPEGLALDGNVARLLGAAPTQYQRDSLVDSAGRLCARINP